MPPRTNRTATCPFGDRKGVARWPPRERFAPTDDADGVRPAGPRILETCERSDARLLALRAHGRQERYHRPARRDVARTGIHWMARSMRARRHFHEELEALDLAQRLPEMDDPVDRLNRSMYREVAACSDDQDILEWAIRMMIVSRQLERVGDHAVDIGEQVAFLLTGEFQEFTDASHPEVGPGR